MAKPLSELIKKVKPAVVAAARAQADHDAFVQASGMLKKTTIDRVAFQKTKRSNGESAALSHAGLPQH